MVWNDVYSAVPEEKAHSYDHLNLDGDSDTLLTSEELENIHSPYRSCRAIHWILHGISIMMWIGILVFVRSTYNTSHRAFLEQTHAWSPMLGAIDSDYRDVYWNGSLWYQSPYKGPPSPQVEQAWQDLMQYGLISVSAGELQRAGYSPNSVQFPLAAGGGYLATATGTHHIHCLHYIWQDHHSAYFPSVQANKAAVPEMYERHYEHCIDYIRQGIMCNYDVTMIAYNWVKTHNSPTPNGNTNHKCVDWNRAQEWLKERAVEMPEGFSWKQPDDAEPLDYNP